MNARLSEPMPWAPADHVAGQETHPADPLPGVRFDETGTHLLDTDGTPFFELTPAQGKTVVDCSLEVAKRIATTVLGRVSAW